MKQYCIVPGYGLEYSDHENISINWPKNSLLTKPLPPKTTRYTVCTAREVKHSDFTHIITVHVHFSTMQYSDKAEDKISLIFRTGNGNEKDLGRFITRREVA